MRWAGVSGNRYLAVVNAGAGSARAGAVEAVVRELRPPRRRRAAPHAPAWTTCAPPCSGAGGRRVVLLGGDGSLHAALQLLWNAGATRDGRAAGHRPAGYGQRPGPLAAPAAGPGGRGPRRRPGSPRGLELLVDSHDRITVNTVHAGIGASATAKAQRLKRVLRAGAYPVGAAWAGVSAGRGFRLRVDVDGRTVSPSDRPVLVVGIGIGGTIGGGAPLVPGADPHDGLADVVVSESTGPLARLGFAAGLRSGVHVERQDVLTATGQVVEVSAVSGTFRLNSDGEVTDPQRYERFEMHTDVYEVVCP